MKGSEEVIVVRPSEPDAFGDPSDEATTLAIFERCVVWPRQSVEVAAEGNVITDGYNVFVPWDVGVNREQIELLTETVYPGEVTGDDRIVVRGKEWQIVGTPADHRSVRGKRKGLQMIVGRVA